MTYYDVFCLRQDAARRSARRIQEIRDGVALAMGSATPGRGYFSALKDDPEEAETAFVQAQAEEKFQVMLERRRQMGGQ